MFIPPIKVFKPTANPDPLASFRKARVEVGGLTSIQNITAVGTLLEPDGALSGTDHLFLRSAFRLLRDQHILISPQFRLTAMNIAGGEKGDFLKYPPLTDLLLIMFIDHNIGKSPFGEPHRYCVSELHTVKDSWRNAAVLSGANIIVAFRSKSGHEIDYRDFWGDYKGIQSTDFCDVLSRTEIADERLAGLTQAAVRHKL
jgi:hypothetical protein